MGNVSILISRYPKERVANNLIAVDRLCLSIRLNLHHYLPRLEVGHWVRVS